MTGVPLHVHRPDKEAIVHYPAPLEQPQVLLQLRQEARLGPGGDDLVRDVVPARADHVDHLHAVEAADPAEQRSLAVPQHVLRVQTHHPPKRLRLGPLQRLNRVQSAVGKPEIRP